LLGLGRPADGRHDHDAPSRPDGATLNLVYYVATSLDGYIATPDGGIEWLNPFNDPDIDYGYDDFIGGIDAIVMGSRTYEVSRALDESMTPGKPTWVCTKRDLPASPNVTCTSATPAEVVEALADRGLKDVWLMGGGQLATSFREAGLITRYVITFIPVILGGGIPLFARGGSLETLALVEGKVFPNSVVMFEFEPAEEALFDFEPADD